MVSRVGIQQLRFLSKEVQDGSQSGEGEIIVPLRMKPPLGAAVTPRNLPKQIRVDFCDILLQSEFAHEHSRNRDLALLLPIQNVLNSPVFKHFLMQSGSFSPCLRPLVWHPDRTHREGHMLLPCRASVMACVSEYQPDQNCSHDGDTNLECDSQLSAPSLDKPEPKRPDPQCPEDGD